MNLISLAAYRDHEVLYDGKIIALKRGQVPTSERELMKRWQWASRGKVRRFLLMLEDSGKIVRTTGRKKSAEKRDHGTDHQTDHGLTVISISKYDTYQDQVAGNGTTVEPTKQTAHGPRSDHGRTKQNKGNKGNKDIGVKKKTKCELSEGWVPTEAHLALADKEGVNLEREAEKFRNHATGSGRRQIDWNAAFRNWILSEYADRSPSNKRPKREGLVQEYLPW